MGLVHREQSKISEESVWPLLVIVEALSLTRAVLLPTHQRPQPPANKTVDGREREPVGMLEVVVPAAQSWIQSRNRGRNGVAAAALCPCPDFIP